MKMPTSEEVFDGIVIVILTGMIIAGILHPKTLLVPLSILTVILVLGFIGKLANKVFDYFERKYNK